MKSLRLSLLTTVGLLSGVFSATSAFSAAPPLPAALVGSYQGILQVPGQGEDEGLPFGRIEILTTTASKATGKLVLIDKKPYPFSITLTANVDGSAATGSAILVKKATPLPAQTLLDLTLTIKNDGTFEASGNSTLTTLPASTFEELPGAAFKTPTFVPVKAPCPWVGAYTASFSDVEPAGNGAPTGSGYMTATTATSGVMTVIGKLADGTAITGTMKPSADGRHFLFLTPYTTTVGGYFVSAFQLTQRSDNRWHVAADTDWTKWKKPASLKDKSHPNGFGPLDVLLTMAQWVAPVGTGNNVGTVMGIDPLEVFDFGIEAAVINPAIATHAKALPLRLGLNTTNTLKIGAPNALFPAQWTPIFTGKVDPKTGLITMTIKIEDVVPVVFPAKPKPNIKRTVTIAGVMFQLLPADPGPIASGFGWVPALVTTLPNIYGGFSFSNVRVDPAIAEAATTAGSYTTTLQNQPSGLAYPDNAPKPLDGNGRINVAFTIAPDLKTITFNGRVLPISGDSRPVSIVFSDAKASTVTNNVTVTAFLNFTGVVTHVSTMYVRKTGLIPAVGYLNSVNNTTFKQP